MGRDKRTRKDKVEEHFRAAPILTPKTQAQAEYMNFINTSPFTLAIGYAGTGKTYIPARMAASMYKQGKIEKIILLRPAVSASASLGFFKGTREEKMKNWLAPILGALQEELPPMQIDYMLKEEVGHLDFCPLETVKGNSWKNAFIIVDEAEDCTLKELKSLLSRIGTNSTMVICGDIHQCDLAKSGLGQLIDLTEKDEGLFNILPYVNFNEEEDIVRSEACKEIILGFERLGL